jgi:hypothetical protein
MLYGKVSKMFQKNLTFLHIRVKGICKAVEPPDGVAVG